MKTEHTPLPWHYDSIDQVRSKNGTVIARCERRERHEYMDSREQSANARFIARACSAHYGLVEALERLHEYANLTRLEIDDKATGWYYQLSAAIDKARAAIAKAKEGV